MFAGVTTWSRDSSPKAGALLSRKGLIGVDLPLLYGEGLVPASNGVGHWWDPKSASDKLALQIS